VVWAEIIKIPPAEVTVRRMHVALMEHATAKAHKMFLQDIAMLEQVVGKELSKVRTGNAHARINLNIFRAQLCCIVG
jgi:hypothetical protein